MTRVKVEIRAMRSGDESLLLYLAQETLQRLAAGFGHPELYRPGELLELLATAEVYVAESGSEIAGFVAVEHDAEALDVRCLCVSPAHEAQAVAHQLVAWVEGVACAASVGRLRAFVPAADEPSRHLYRGHEFVPRPVAGRPDLVALEKRLRADA